MRIRGHRGTQKTAAFVLALVVAGGAGEIGLRVFLRSGASDEQVRRYGSLEQLIQRFGDERLIPHRYLGFVTRPDYSSLESLINLQLRVLELDPDLVLIYHGINETRSFGASPRKNAFR